MDPHAQGVADNRSPANGLHTKNHPRFPSSVFLSIAESLADDVALRTLARLNHTSRAVHQVTLPALYETLRLDDPTAFLKSTKSKDLKGFQHTRYLILNQPLYLLLQHHIRYTRHDDTNWEVDPDFRTVFPRLLFLFITDFSEHGSAGHLVAPASVHLFKSIPLDVLLERCTPREDDSMARRLTFYGVAYDNLGTGTSRNKLGYWPHERLYESVDITHVHLGKGAGLLAPVDGRKMKLERDGEPIVDEGGSFQLTIDAESSDKNTRNTIRTVLEYLDFVITNGRDQNQIYFDLTCRPSILKTFTEILFGTQPAPFRKLDINLQGTDTTPADMKRHVQVFADHYAHGFQQGAEQSEYWEGCFPYVEIQATTPVPEEYADEMRDTDPTELEGFITGQIIGSILDYYNVCESASRKEFTCSVEVGYNVRGSREEGKEVWKKKYPSTGVEDLHGLSLDDDDWTDEE